MDNNMDVLKVKTRQVCRIEVEPSTPGTYKVWIMRRYRDKSGRTAVGGNCWWLGPERAVKIMAVALASDRLAYSNQVAQFRTGV
jgi:hypothetical protein